MYSIDKENVPTAYSVKTIFEEAPAECFVGSVWNLPNNGKGSITFDAEGTLCAPGAVRNIVWSIYRSEEHTSELQSLMRISYAVFCLKKKKIQHITPKIYHTT